MSSPASYFLNKDDTIVALSSPSGASHTAIIRLSGPEATSIVARILAVENDSEIPHSHPAAAGTFRVLSGKVALSNSAIPAKVYIMKAPYSYSREDVLELHIPGSPALASPVIQRTLDEGARIALAGEFTFRAFANGRIDLPQAEAVGKIIAARSQAERRLAADELGGKLSLKLAALRDEIFQLVVKLEASIDFSDQDIRIISGAELKENLQRLIGEFEELQRKGRDDYYFHEGVDVALLGVTNAGKSSLCNALLERPLALVGSAPMTTRDPLDESIIIEDVLFNLWDTAGIVKTCSRIDEKAMRKTAKIKETAHIILFVVDGSRPITDQHRELYRSIADRNHIVAVNKVDLENIINYDVVNREFNSPPVVFVSALTGQGIYELKKELVRIIKRGAIDTTASHFLLNVRQRNALERGLNNLKRALEAAENNAGDELVCTDIRLCLDDFAELLGHVEADDFLGRIFADFCVGK